MADGNCSFTECLQIRTLLFAEKMSVVKWRVVWSSREQDSTEVPDFAFRSFCPIGILLGSAFPKPCYTQPDGCGNLAQRQSFANSIAAQGFQNRLSWNQRPQPAQKTFFTAILNKRQIFVRCKVKGQSIGTKPEADSLSKVERFSEIFSPAVPSFREKMSVVCWEGLPNRKALPVPEPVTVWPRRDGVPCYENKS